MQAQAIIEKIVNEFSGVIPKSTWGETSLFYNPENFLPNGVYFCTIKEKNGDNDKASELDREGVFRLSIGITKASYERLFGARPSRPAKGCIIDTAHEFTLLDELMPHPIYGWMSWIQILNPSESSLATLIPLLQESYDSAVIKFNKKRDEKGVKK